MHRFIFTAALLPLAACNSGGPTVTATNASQSEVKAKVAAATGDASLVSPGRWEGSMTIHDMKMPDLPPALQGRLADKMGEARKFVSCVTPEDVKAKRAFFTGDNDDKSCTYQHFTMSGGTIDAAMTCKRENVQMAATMKGSYSASAYHMDMQSDTKGAGPNGNMTMAMTVDAKRTGACTGTENKE